MHLKYTFIYYPYSIVRRIIVIRSLHSWRFNGDSLQLSNRETWIRILYLFLANLRVYVNLLSVSIHIFGL